MNFERRTNKNYSFANEILNQNIYDEPQRQRQMNVNTRKHKFARNRVGAICRQLSFRSIDGSLYEHNEVTTRE